MSHTRRKYDPEFKAGAVRIVRETRRPVVEIARGTSRSSRVAPQEPPKLWASGPPARISAPPTARRLGNSRWAVQRSPGYPHSPGSRRETGVSRNSSRTLPPSWDMRELQTPRSEATALSGLERISRNPGTFFWL